MQFWQAYLAKRGTGLRAPRWMARPPSSGQTAWSHVRSTSGYGIVSRYRLALADAEAALAVQHAQHLMLRDQYQRRSKLSLGHSITIEALDNARRQSESAAASYQQAIASRDTATLNLNRTEVRAPVNGFITNLNLAKGTYASQGKPVMALIDSDSYRVTCSLRSSR